MAANGLEANEYVYRICSAQEWEEFLIQGFSFGEPIDMNFGFITLCMLHQVRQILLNFFLSVAEDDLYLLQIDTKELGDGLVYEALLLPSPTNPSTSEYDIFPCFYGPLRSFCPLPLNAVVRAEKLTFTNGQLSCNLLN